MVSELLAFAGVMALGQFSPGPDMLLLTRTSLAEGTAQGVKMAFGIATGLALHATLAVGGVALLFEQSTWWKTALSWAAAAYLVYLAKLIFEEVRAMLIGAKYEVEAPRQPKGGAYRRGLLCNLLNPKVAVFLAAVTAPFLQGDRPGWWPLALWAIMVFESLLLWSLWAGFLQWRPVRSGYQKVRPWLDAGFGIVLIALAVLLVLGGLK